ncbi:amidase [Halobacteriales archaeon QH_6_64_20]|nr:MAG: amidase [Halobacteriales archaeon QH_6_64_20]
MTDVAYSSATDLAARIRRGDLSPVDVVEEFLDRIATRNDATNAFVTVAEERAREAAREAERAIENGDEVGPLCGVPIAVKDLDHVAGVRTTSGSRLFEGFVPDESDPFASRLEEAGAVVIGKTNTPEFGLGCTTDNLVAGPTPTPFDLDRVAGGSSGGAGAALADGLCPVAQGSDTGGSIRTPAAFCGVYGLKPSFGRVPLVDRPNAFSNHSPFSHLGPMARTVEDAALTLDVMAGPHPRDPFSLPDSGTTYRDAVGRDIDDVEVAYSLDLGTYPVDPGVEDTVTEAAEAFGDAGAAVSGVEMDIGGTQAEILEAYYTFARAKWNALFDRLASGHGLDPRGSDREKLRPVVRETVLDAERPTTAEVERAEVVRTRVLDGIQDVLASHDLLVTPTTAVPPFPIGEHPTEVAGTEIEPLRGWVLTQPFNLSGHPVASIPAGLVDGLPVGMQVVGRRHADGKVLAASAAYEQARPWHDAYPPR